MEPHGTSTILKPIPLFKMTMNWFVTLTVSCAVVQITVGIPNPDEVYHSLAFVFDTTGSMYDDYVQLKSHAEGIMNYVLQRNNTDIKHFVFVPFNDPDVGPVSETFDPNVIMYKLNQVFIGRGGDCPEMGITAIIKALKAVKPNSYIYVFTDSSPKDSNLFNEALELIQKKQPQVFILKTGDNCLASDNNYENIALLGLGYVFDVSKSDVSKVLEFVKTSMDTNRVNLLSVNIPLSQKIAIPKKMDIDESIKSLLVSVTGTHSNIDLVNPKGKIMDKAHGLMTNLDLKNVKIVSILEPLPGEWTLYVTSESAHTIHICGISTKSFDFGFATERPKNMSQTSYRPLKGVENYILIHCPDVNTFLSCSLQYLNRDGETESLPTLNFGKNMLLCGPFVPNNNPFYVQVFGKNNNGNYFKRITKTSIISDESETPYITTTEKIIAITGEELHINCHVESLVPFTVTWKAQNYTHYTWNFNRSSEIELVIHNVTEHHDGIYKCIAENIAGNSESSTNVTVMSLPTIVEGSNNVTVVLYEGEDYSMTCTGQGKPVPNMKWLKNNMPISYYNHNEHILIINDDMRLVIYDATLSDTNVYTCRASNEAGMAEKHYHVFIFAKTTNTTANELVVADELDDVNLRCPLSSANYLWFKDGVNINDIIYKRADEPHFKQMDNKMKIYELSSSDHGIYLCKTSNETYTFYLQVDFQPYFKHQYRSQIMKTTINETVILDCMANGHPLPLVSWRKIESTPLPITLWTLKSIEFLENKQKLKIQSVDWTHNGTYYCQVKNNLGIVKRHIELLVLK